MALLPGTRLLLEGFYKIRFQLGEAVGRSAMYVRGGRMLGGNSAFVHIGTYVETDGGIDIEIKTAGTCDDEQGAVPDATALAGKRSLRIPEPEAPDGMTNG